MKKYIFNRKPLDLIKNKEFNFNIPVSIDTRLSEFTLECPDFDSSKFELKVRFNIGKDYKKLFREISLKSGYNLFNFNELKPEEQGKYILYSCIASESINLALTIKESTTAL